ncbi:hypothetical protein AMS68_002789 [Peltaster fructicola]|uniref:Ubiquitin-like domain-containing protein n=1 Tax=Peltaster fructicola TaxID=286661 RepID=A0A6H0XR70_9PEZI|nr:hypothetical protein AMS68_002789 [Peltaster fructicola]
MASIQPAFPLELIIRFSTSEPDQTLHILDSQKTSGLGLKQHIRAKLSASANSNRLRLIHAGKVIADSAALSQSLGTLSAPPGRDSGTAKSEKAKGKLPVREVRAATRVYIHCSIGDVLSPAELEHEAKQAEEANAALLSDNPLKLDTTASQSFKSTQDVHTTTPAPQGFDRLLSAGFTQAEVATLRSQFLAIQSHTHTPDTMPTGPALLALEERWLEQPNANTANGNGMAEIDGDDGLDDMLWGSLVGFFWPIGVMCWLIREEGVWSRRRQLMVLLGVFINLMFGFLRLLR